MDFIKCEDILKAEMTIDEDKFEDAMVKVKVEEEEEDPIAVPEELLSAATTTPAEEKRERPSRRAKRVLLQEVESLRNTRRRPKQSKTVAESSRIFWCFGVPRHSSCDLCFGSCLPLRCRKCKVVRARNNLIKSYDCAVCGKSCKDIPQFKEHMKSEHVDLKCKDCGKSFPSKSRLKSHSSIHKEKKYLCELCSSAFHRLDQYKSHYKRKHTDLKDFICRECGKSWKTKGDLSQHMRVHDDRYRPVRQIKSRSSDSD
ncbi:hypothetical protein LSTR_LSTR014669 [Laodelphax striatellus]|uniref:C2H2-type domain-containing protein n=1 Tax=Laodelphax striatellus TaxID=195883 RepID=A0A482X0F4_LAOST|nr:hypothetical protein LSTR_LSTR014669 [Laodelphax striatellus]